MSWEDMTWEEKMADLDRRMAETFASMERNSERKRELFMDMADTLEKVIEVASGTLD
jgi:hypothetical protein